MGEGLLDLDVLVIGNGGDKPSFNPEDYDSIIRMNQGILEGDANIWVMATFTEDLIDTRNHYDEFWRLNFQKESRWPKALRDDLMEQYGMVNNPSTGLSLLWGLMQVEKPRSITIVGYTGSTNRITQQRNYPKHNWELERKIVREWLDKGLIRSLDESSNNE